MWDRAIKLGLKGVLAGSPKGATQRLQGAPVGPTRAPNPHVLENLASSDFRAQTDSIIVLPQGYKIWSQVVQMVTKMATVALKVSQMAAKNRAHGPQSSVTLETFQSDRLLAPKRVSKMA